MGLGQVGEGEGGRIGGEEVPGQTVQGLGGHGEDVGFTLREERARGGILTEGRGDLTGVNWTCLVAVRVCRSRWSRGH